MRWGGDEALLVAGGATGTRDGVTTIRVEVAPEVRPSSTPVSFPFMEDEATGEFVFTKRCSRGSYAMEESLPSDTPGTPDLLSTTVLEKPAGGPVATRPLLRPSRGDDFNACHFCPGSTGMTCALTPFVPTFEKTPRSKFKGSFPFLSSGCIGTMPFVPPLRTKTAVTG